MGASLDFRIYDHTNREQITADFKSACESARVEDGVLSPGTIAAFEGIGDWQEDQLNSRDAAIAYLSEHHQKQDYAMAVSFFLPAEPSVVEQEKIAALKKRVDSWRERVQKARQDAVDNFKARRSGSVGCGECNSRLSHSHLAARAANISNVVCPVCHSSLVGKPDQLRIEKLLVRVEKAEKEHAEAIAPRPSEQIAWLVGGWCRE